MTQKCAVIQGWKSHLRVMDHPFFAVTDAEGKFEIPGLSPGEYTLVAWHERMGEKEIVFGQGGEALKEIEFSFRLKDG